MEEAQKPVDEVINSSETSHIADFIGPVIPNSNETKSETNTDSSESVLSVSNTTPILALQNQYMAAIIKNKPGITGEKSTQVAHDLINSGIQPTEALMLINIVYGGPNYHPSGKGQGTRLKYFSEAITDVWGNRLENASKHPALFRGLLAKINDATEMRDQLREEDNDYGISFKEALLLQEISIDVEYFLGLAESLVSEYGISRRDAKYRIKKAAEQVKASKCSSLEGILFPTKPRESDSEHYEQ